MVDLSITSTEITELARHCKHTPYAKLMDGIADLTEKIEQEYLFRPCDEDALEVFRETFNQRFYNLYDRVFSPLKVQAPLPTGGAGYVAYPQPQSLRRAEHMTACVFVDGEPILLSPTHSRNRETALAALQRKLPEGYDVEFVCNTEHAHPVFAVGQARTLYYLNPVRANGFDLFLYRLTQQQVHEFPLLILTPTQCDELHINSFIVGFISSFNAMYPQCDWNLFTNGFREVVYDKFLEYCRIWGYKSPINKSRFVSMLATYAAHNSTNRFSSMPPINISFFYKEQTTMRVEYMKVFCQLYRERMMFPRLEDIQEQANENLEIARR